MATTTPDTSVDRTQTMIDWARINSRYLTIGAAVVVVAAIGFWFYTRSQEIRIAKADQALLQAKQSLGAGNAALATNDLQKLVGSYGNTAAGAVGAEMLAQLDYDSGKYQDGITVLQKSIAEHTGDVLADLYSMVGDGYAQMHRMDDAAKAYQQASDATSMQDLKAYQLAKAARTYVTAGKKQQAIDLWTKLAGNDSVPSVATEAKVRLGELTAKPAT